MTPPTDRGSSVLMYSLTWIFGTLVGALIAVAWSGLTGHSGDFSYETSIGWHADVLWKDIQFALVSAVCVLVFTAPLAPTFLRRFKGITVTLAFIAPIIGQPLIGQLVPGVEGAPTYYFTVYVIGGLLAGGVAGIVALVATLILPAAHEEDTQDGALSRDISELLDGA